MIITTAVIMGGPTPRNCCGFMLLEAQWSMIEPATEGGGPDTISPFVLHDPVCGSTIMKHDHYRCCDHGQSNEDNCRLTIIMHDHPLPLIPCLHSSKYYAVHVYQPFGGSMNELGGLVVSG